MGQTNLNDNSLSYNILMISTCLKPILQKIDTQTDSSLSWSVVKSSN